MTTTESAKRKHDRAITFLTQGEMQRLFFVIKNKRDRAIFAVAYRHGLRASEVGMLQRTDLDLRAARIPINRVKGSISGTYPMSPDTVKLIRSYRNSRKDASPYLFCIQPDAPHRSTHLVGVDEEVRIRRRHSNREATIPCP